MVKLTMHCQMVPGWVQGWLQATGAGWVKGIDSFPNFPGVNTIGRTYMPDNESNALVWQGVAGAEQWFSRWLPVYRANPHVHCWEAPNEPHPMSEPAFRRALDEFTVRLAFLMQAEGLRLVGMNWSVGWPDIGHAPEFRKSMEELAYRGHYLGLHEYSAPAMWDGDGWYTLRYRRTVNELRNAGIPVPPILITECGIDGGVVGNPKKGWKTYTNEAGYVAQLIWYETELQRDDDVKAATIFTAGPYGDWLDFEVTQSLSEVLADALGTVPTPSPPSSSPSSSPSPSPSPSPPPPDYAKGIDVSDHQGVIDWEQVKAAGYDFAMIRASVCQSDGDVVKDGQFDRNWPEAKRVGMLREAHHYLGTEGWGQAKFLVNTVPLDDLPEIGYYGDLEHGGLDSERCELFLGAVDRNLIEHDIVGICDVYSRASFLNQFGVPLPWSYGRRLWVSSPGQPEPVMPDAWEDWEFWQYGQREVAGISGLVDVNYFNGTREELFAKYGGGGEINVKFYDTEGNEQNQEWAETYFGLQDAHQPDEFPVYELTKLEAYQGSADLHVLIAEVLGQDGKSLEGIEVAFGPRDVQGEIQRKFTDGDGQVAFKMTDAHRFPVPGEQGHYVVAVLGRHSHVYNSAGWVQGQHRWLDPVFQLRTDEPPPPPPTGIKYVWYDGSEVDEAAFRAEFGDYDIEGDAKHKVVELRAVEHDNNLRMKLLDKDGNIIYDKLAVLSWPDAQPLPECGWDGKGLVAQVKEETGDAAHPMGPGAAYEVAVEGKGPHRIWWCNDSQLVGGIGWLRYTHYKHFNVTMQETDKEPPIYHHLYYSAEPEEAGYVVAKPEPVNDQLPEGTVVTLTAHANEGWLFDHWSIPVAPTTTITIEMTQDWAIAAHFVEEGNGDIDVPAAIEDGYVALGATASALEHLGEEKAVMIAMLEELL